MKKYNVLLVITFLATIAMPLLSQAQSDAPPPPPVREPKPLAEKMRPADDMAPTVSITRKGDTITEEYRVQGTLVMVKVIPRRGAPYYLMDTDGDGDLESRTSDFEKVQPVMWKLFSWGNGK